ncbi:Pleiotropic regulatory protein [Fictibacillus macauensis ZFHKF-1]|uniref:Pleiotropic regulatory protein n=1 Tax=Fictibacillus macauensis ZFHKF-1 TaxID=1196324 RepID=I8J545_9BACL|nr:DegT/DnrJ/EryC1/StrS family aminotransferase [Fictibacillus macauensis]EIT86926.1 Pleiotropic regulatory protein [Fictibacillus macauensis ZFHKF-1]
MRVPMFDMQEQYEDLRAEMLPAVDEVMKKSRFILGENVTAFEQEMAAYCHVSHSVGVASGSDALYLTLLALNIGPGDEVIVPSFTFFASASAVARTGAVPVFADISPSCYTLDLGSVEAKRTERTKAIIAVHLYGQMAQMGELMALARKHSLYVIEDAAQALGATQNGKPPGAHSHAAILSFFPTKNLGAYGDAGMVVTNNAALAEKINVLRVHGSKPKYYHHELGCNSRLDELQAAILRVKFPHLAHWNERRREIAAYYDELLLQKVPDLLSPPVVAKANEHVFHQYTLFVNKRKELVAFLQQAGIETMIYYPLPLHLQPVFSSLGYEVGSLPETERASQHVLSLPMFPELKKEQQVYVVDQLAAFYAQQTMLKV